MLKSVRDLFRSIKCLPQLKAIAQPSVVDVPRPSSSTHTKEFFVASRKGFAISDISTAKVENPERKSSLAPMRTKIASQAERLKVFAGTEEPMCARMVAMQICRR